MSDLPPDRITPHSAPFTFVGIDMFGPWSVVTRRTRGGQVHNKRWALLFTCLCTRAVHIEIVEDTVKNFLFDKGVTWIFNSPHSSHMGGVWERIIGITRRILDAMLMDLPSKNLTHDVLVTLMAEVCAILNSRPITTISTDPECPEVLSPSMLLTQKSDCITALPREFNLKDMYKSQWKMVQHLANCFWVKWQREYLNMLQRRQKWKSFVNNIKIGDVILLKDKTIYRNEWPIGLIVRVFPSPDGNVRKAEVRIIKDGKPTTYIRPITEFALLLSE